MRPSTHLFISDVEHNWIGIYSPFGHKVAFLDNSDWRKIQTGSFNELDSSLLHYLLECNILVEDGFEDKWFADYRNRIVSIPEFNWMYLVVTTDCNFACKYCSVKGNETHSSNQITTMDTKIGIAAINLFKRNLEKCQPSSARVTFYGGEPLLNEKLLFDLIPRIRQINYPGMKSPIEIGVITNGYIYHPELTKLLVENHVDIAISVDGKKEQHDKARILKSDGSGTFDTIRENYFKYKNAGIKVGISATIGTHNMNVIPEIAQYFAEELEAEVVEFQVPCVVPGKGEYFVSTEIIGEELMKGYGVLRSLKVIEGLALRRLMNFSRGTIRVRDCKSSGSQLVVAPDGTIGPCHSLVGSRVYFTGNVCDENTDPTRLENFCEWAKRYPFNMDECLACPFITLCGGGCLYNSYISSGTIWNKDPQICAYMKNFVEWILRDLWRKVQSNS